MYLTYRSKNGSTKANISVLAYPKTVGSSKKSLKADLSHQKRGVWLTYSDVVVENKTNTALENINIY